MEQQVATRQEQSTPRRLAPSLPAAVPVRQSRPGRWVLVPLLVFLASRVVSIVMLLLAGAHQEPVTGPAPAEGGTSLDQLLANWDGGWYKEIATQGYPDQLPRTDGAVVQNVWAFYPLLPSLARLLMLGGVGFSWAATLVALAASSAACVVLYAMVRERAGDFTAAMAVATLTLGPIGLVFSAAYTEGLAMLLVLLSLRALGRRQWGRLLLCGLVLAFTRPITLALAAVCGLTWLALWWRRGTEPFLLRDRVQLAVVTMIIGASFLAWPTVAGLATGEADAYRLTQAAWIPDGDAWTTWLSGLVGHGAVATTAAAVTTLLLVCWVAVRPSARAWPLEGRLWTVVYTLYILAATRPTSSILRYLVLAIFPTWPTPEVSTRFRTTRERIAVAVPVLVLCCVAQWWWTSNIWVMHGGRSLPP